MPKYHVMDATGHSTTEFDLADKVALEDAEKRFTELTGRGFTAAKLAEERSVEDCQQVCGMTAEILRSVTVEVRDPELPLPVEHHRYDIIRDGEEMFMTVTVEETGESYRVGPAQECVHAMLEHRRKTAWQTRLSGLTFHRV